MNYWLVKSEPVKYSWAQFVKDGHTVWDGVRNYAARNNLMAMRTGDTVLYYHSNEGLEIVGIAGVIREAYQDPTTEAPAWKAVDLAPNQKLKQPVTLAAMKAEPALAGLSLIRQSRLSVCPVTAAEYACIIKMGGGLK